MSIACQITNGKNAVSIYDEGFNESLIYQVRLIDQEFCSPTTIVNVDSVFFCNDTAELNFILPCLPIGNYKLEVLSSSTVIYTLNSIYHK